MTDMAKKSTKATPAPKTLSEALEIIEDLHDSLDAKTKDYDALDTERKEQLDEQRKELEAEAETRVNEIERTALYEFDLQDALAKFGGHQDCLMGAVTGAKLHPQCTCGWNHYATLLETVHNGGI